MKTTLGNHKLEMIRNKKKLDFQQKLEIIKSLENGDKPKHISQKYNVNKSTIARIKKNKEVIEEFCQNCIVSPNKIKKLAKIGFPETEMALYDWFLDKRLKHNIITNDILRSKAIDFQNKLESQKPFEVNFGWIQNFKRRHGIRSLKLCSEKLSSNESAILPFTEQFKQTINSLNLCPEQTYNTDETTLVFQNLNDRTLVATHEKNAPGRKYSKEKVTLMPCTNATGEHKLPLMLIGKSRNPRCFKNFVLPTMYYRSSTNAW